MIAQRSGSTDRSTRLGADPSADSVRKPRIAYVVNNAEFFVSHRLVIALAARHSSYSVLLLTGRASSPSNESQALPQLADASIAHWSGIFTSGGMNPVVEVFGFFQRLWWLWRCKPDIVHCASPKDLLHGG